MNTIPLSEYVEGHSQTAAAKLLGVSQPAVRQAMLAGRKIYLTFDNTGQFVSAHEVSPFPARKAAAA